MAEIRHENRLLDSVVTLIFDDVSMKLVRLEFDNTNIRALILDVSGNHASRHAGPPFENITINIPPGLQEDWEWVYTDNKTEPIKGGFEWRCGFED